MELYWNWFTRADLRPEGKLTNFSSGLFLRLKRDTILIDINSLDLLESHSNFLGGRNAEVYKGLVSGNY